MKQIAKVIIVFSLIVPVFAQNGAWWEPEFPIKGDSLTIYFDASQNSVIPNNTTTLVLHWGINEVGTGNWETPPPEIRPPGSVVHTDNIAVRSPMVKVGDVWQIKLATRLYVETLHFVVNTGTPSAPGSYWGKNTGDTNWDLTLSEGQIRAILVQPVLQNFGDPRRSPAFVALDESLEIIGTAGTQDTDIDSLFLFIGDQVVAADTTDTLTYDFIASEYGLGAYPAQLIARDIRSVKDTTKFEIMVIGAVVDEALPDGVIPGINYIDDSSLTLCLFAPYKEFVYVIGDINDWLVDSLYAMKRHVVDQDNVYWWLTLDGLTAGQEYAFQYLVDGQIRIADPYTEKILDPWNDQEIINNGFYPGLKEYPFGYTTDAVGIMQTAQVTYNWQYTDSFTPPARHELIIYELLMRDFLEQQTYATLIDTLDYLQNLGINAIELMPVNEFEGNNSWGYNPSFYFAPDKYYGPADDLKAFIDECHRRGIAVILDMVLNHSFGQSPLVRLYWDSENNRPAQDNPWFNPIPRHPFNVGYDMNHESTATKTFVDRVNTFWINEYKIDGFRFDLSKGFTQFNSGGDVGLWGQYDASRIALLKRMANTIWAVDADTYVILEHFAEDSEEIELSNYGMLLWGNMNYNYNEATMGYHESGKSNFSRGYYRVRNWTQPHLITYMESHDEERLMFKNLTYGEDAPGYNIRTLEVALNRMKMAAAFFFMYPGPKMIWQFGELGYQFSINYPSGQENDRLTPKPIRWDYYQEELRRKLYKTFATLINLRKSETVFNSPDAFASLSVSQSTKQIRVSHPTMEAVIVGNFDVVEKKIDPGFNKAGNWYDYFSGETLTITDTSDDTLTLAPGEFHIYTDKPLPAPEEDILNSLRKTETVTRQYALTQNYPNPFNPSTTIEFDLPEPTNVQLRIYDILGREVIRLVDNQLTSGRYQLTWAGKNSNGVKVGSGVFVYELLARKGGKILFQQTRKMILLK